MENKKPMEKELNVYIWYKSADKHKEYKGIRCATEDEHKSDSGYLLPGEVEQKLMSCETLVNKSHEEICNTILLKIIMLEWNFSDDDKEQITGDVRLLAESLI